MLCDSLRVTMMIDNRMRSMINLNFSLVDRDLISIAEDRSDFLEWLESCVREREQRHKATDQTENDEEEIKLPTDGSAIWCQWL